MSQYVQAAINNVENSLKENGKTLIKAAKTPLQNNYNPELDTSKELSDEESNQYQSLIGILRWIVEMGRIDICMEVSVMSSYVACPREGHYNEI